MPTVLSKQEAITGHEAALRLGFSSDRMAALASQGCWLCSTANCQRQHRHTAFAAFACANLLRLLIERKEKVTHFHL